MFHIGHEDDQTHCATKNKIRITLWTKLSTLDHRHFITIITSVYHGNDHCRIFIKTSTNLGGLFTQKIKTYARRYKIIFLKWFYRVTSFLNITHYMKCQQAMTTWEYCVHMRKSGDKKNNGKHTANAYSWEAEGAPECKITIQADKRTTMSTWPREIAESLTPTLKRPPS